MHLQNTLCTSNPYQNGKIIKIYASILNVYVHHRNANDYRFYNDIYKDILKRTGKLYLFPGVRRDRFFVNTVIAVLLFLLAIGSKDTSDTIEGLEFKSKWQAVEIQYLREYHDASETLLDSLGVDCDHHMLESDAGSDYLNAKFNLDEYENDR